MALGTLLQYIGVPEAIAVVAVAALAVWHLRSATQMLVTAGFAAKVVGMVSIVAVAAWSGLIPGVSVSVAVDRLASFLTDILDFLIGIGQSAVEAAA